MKINHLFAFASIVLLAGNLIQAQIYHRTDTLYIPEALVLPAIDGSAEVAWDQVSWNPINQIWMPWDNESANLGQEAGLQLWSGANDFTGNFKVMWSSETNLLYFLVEITDDAFVDGYAYPAGGYPNYDIVEIFIDEDRSGGPHVFDNTLYPGMSNCPTCNAQNAFSYHIAANALADNEVQTEKHAVDIAGTTWGTTRDYEIHIPEFALRKDGEKYYWEFSFIVHNDTYDHNNQEASVVDLEEGKIMGLSMAYCDNDNPAENPLRRDHFFGSVDVPLSAHNSHWINADWFGVAKLTGSSTTSGNPLKTNESLKVFMANQNIAIRINSAYHGPVQIRLVNILGAEVLRTALNKSDLEWLGSIPSDELHKGIYLVEILQGNNRKVEKIIVQ